MDTEKPLLEGARDGDRYSNLRKAFDGPVDDSNDEGRDGQACPRGCSTSKNNTTDPINRHTRNIKLGFCAQGPDGGNHIDDILHNYDATHSLRQSASEDADSDNH